MSSSDRSIRGNTSFAATATTLMALVAVAAGASAFQPAPVVRLAQAEVVSSLGESAAVRSMAAAVAAVARDLLNGPSVGSAMPPRIARDVVTQPGRPAMATLDPAAKRSLLETLDERLLDLPPPAC